CVREPVESTGPRTQFTIPSPLHDLADPRASLRDVVVGERKDPPAHRDQHVALRLIAGPVGVTRVVGVAVALECDPVVRVRDVEPNDATVGQDHFVLRDRWRTWETRQRGNQGALEVGLRRSEARRARRQDLAELNDTGAAPRADRGDATGEVRDRGQAPAEAVIEGALEPWWLEP